MKEYEEPEITIILFKNENIVTTSGVGGEGFQKAVEALKGQGITDSVAIMQEKWSDMTATTF